MPSALSFFDLHCVLREAYDRLGHHLFGDQWTGYEIDEDRLAPPEEIEAKRAPIEAQLLKIDNDLKSAAELSGRLVKSDDMARADEKSKALSAERESLFRQLRDGIHDPNDSYRTRYAAYQRRAKTEALLIEALGKEKIEGIYGSNMILPGYVWRGERCFRYYLDCSIAVVPRHVSAIRRGTVFVKKSSFANWLKSVAPETYAVAARRSTEERCAEFLLEKIRETSGEQARARDEYFEEARTLIPELSRDGFLRVWGNTVPESWRGRGRRKWHRN